MPRGNVSVTGGAAPPVVQSRCLGPSRAARLPDPARRRDRGRRPRRQHGPRLRRRVDRPQRHRSAGTRRTAPTRRQRTALDRRRREWGAVGHRPRSGRARRRRRPGAGRRSVRRRARLQRSPRSSSLAPPRSATRRWSTLSHRRSGHCRRRSTTAPIFPSPSKPPPRPATKGCVPPSRCRRRRDGPRTWASAASATRILAPRRQRSSSPRLRAPPSGTREIVVEQHAPSRPRAARHPRRRRTR